MNSGFVLDASVAVSWCFSDEATPATAKLLERLKTETAFVPSLWVLEVGNALVLAERKKRITYAEVSEFIELIKGLDIKVDIENSSRGFHEILLIAHSEKITTYDAAYIELAMRFGLPLATRDKQMRVAAKRLGVEPIIL
jgi:predicted nucleic acid-binding protein